MPHIYSTLNDFDFFQSLKMRTDSKSELTEHVNYRYPFPEQN